MGEDTMTHSLSRETYPRELSHGILSFIENQIGDPEKLMSLIFLPVL